MFPPLAGGTGDGGLVESKHRTIKRVTSNRENILARILYLSQGTWNPDMADIIFATNPPYPVAVLMLTSLAPAVCDAERPRAYGALGAVTLLTAPATPVCRTELRSARGGFGAEHVLAPPPTAVRSAVIRPARRARVTALLNAAGTASVHLASDGASAGSMNTRQNQDVKLIQDRDNETHPSLRQRATYPKVLMVLVNRKHYYVRKH